MRRGTSKTKRPRVRTAKPFTDQGWRDWAADVQAGHMRATDLQNHRGQWVTLRANTDAGVLEYFQGGEWRGLGYGSGGGMTVISTEEEAELPNHNLLPGLQGGAGWLGEFYHFQRAAHRELGRFWDGGLWDLSRTSMEKGHVIALYGGIDPSDSLTLASTTDAAKDRIYLGEGHASAYDEANCRLGLGTGTPSYSLHVHKEVSAGDQRTLIYAKNPSAAAGGYAGMTLEADTAQATANLAMFGANYTGIAGWGNRAAVYSGSQASGMIVAANKGAVEFWVLETVVSPPSSTWYHIADVSKGAADYGLFPTEDSKYLLGQEAGPLRWKSLSADQGYFATGLSLLWLGNGLPVISGGAGAVSVLAAARGDLITGQGATAAWAKLARGSSGQFLKMIDANDPGWAALPIASDIVAGIAELATTAETRAGTDATRAATPAGIAGVGLDGKRVCAVKVFDDATVLTTGDGKVTISIPPEISGWNLIAVRAHVTTVSTSGAVNAQLARLRTGTGAGTNDMLSTALTIDANEKDSITAVTAAVINGNDDDVSMTTATQDEIRIDVDGAGTGAKGLEVELTFQKPVA